MTNPVVNSASTKVVRRLLPALMFIFFLCLIDRANISYAALAMNADLNLDAKIYGIAAGIFFIGYFLFEIPSNIALERFGARLWIGRIMITWGLLASAMAAVSGMWSLYTLRFLLGVAEAGLLPGVMFYLTKWIPGRSRGMTLSLLMATTAITYVIGGPLSTWLMTFDGIFGLHGWQFMFLVEGVPTVLVGVLVIVLLPETPREASWLTPEERTALSDAIAREHAETQKNGLVGMRDGLLDRRVLLASAYCFFCVCDNFGTVFWLPQIVSSFGKLSITEVGLLSAIPYALGGIGMVVWGRLSDRSGQRRLHLVLVAVLAAIGYFAAAAAPNPIVAFIAICFATIGVWSMFGLLWAYAGDMLAGPAAATGFAVINSVGALGGFVGPVMIGAIKAQSQSFTGGLYLLSGFAVVTALIGLTLRAPRNRPASMGAGMPLRTGEAA